jgi:prepilin-type N-terminal cleavage/methylation domain-containing protein
MCRRCSDTRGFTLLEVLAALLVAAVAITYLLGSQLNSIRIVSATRELREVTVLAKGKMQELAAGIEAADAGTFEGRDRWNWETRREQVQEALGMSKLTLTVTYFSAGAERTLELEQIVP